MIIRIIRINQRLVYTSGAFVRQHQQRMLWKKNMWFTLLLKTPSLNRIIQMIFLRVRTIFLLTLPFCSQSLYYSLTTVFFLAFKIELEGMRNAFTTTKKRRRIHFKLAKLHCRKKMQFLTGNFKRNKSLFLHLKH